MPQMLAIQPALPQAAPSGSSGPLEQGLFSPHLEKAIASQNNNQQITDKNSEPSTDLPSQQTLSSEENIVSAQADTPISTVEEQSQELPVVNETDVDLVKTASEQPTANSNTFFSEVAVKGFDTGTPLQQTSDVSNTFSSEAAVDGFDTSNKPISKHDEQSSLHFVTRKGNTEPTDAISKIPEVVSSKNETKVSDSAIPLTIKTNLSKVTGQDSLSQQQSTVNSNVAAPTKQPVQTINQDISTSVNSTPDKVQSPLLRQIQLIIDNSNEKGTVQLQGKTTEKTASSNTTIKSVPVIPAQQTEQLPPFKTETIFPVNQVVANKIDGLAGSPLLSTTLPGLSSSIRQTITQTVLQDTINPKLLNPQTASQAISSKTLDIARATNRNMPEADFISKPALTPSTPATHETNTLMPVAQLLAKVDDQLKVAGKPQQQQTTLRQDAQQQLFNARVNGQNQANTNLNSGDTPQDGELSQQSPFTLPQPGLGAGSSEGTTTNTFSQVSAVLQESSTLPPTETVKPTVLPSGHLVYEEEVMQQVHERFRLNSRNMETKINFQFPKFCRM